MAYDLTLNANQAVLGPEGVLAHQSDGRQTWIVDDLGPLESRQYHVVQRYGDPATDDLTAYSTGYTWIAATRQIGVGCSLDEVNISIRNAAGDWAGWAEIIGTFPMSIECTIEAKGPVFAVLRYDLWYETINNPVQLWLRVYARSDRVEVDCYSPVQLDSTIRIYLPPCEVFHAQKLHAPNRSDCPSELPLGDWYSVSLSGLFEGELITYVVPWAPWWGTDVPVARLGYGDGNREYHVCRRSPERWVEEGWGRRPEKNLPLRWTGGSVAIDLTLESGWRCISIADSEATESVGWRPRRDSKGNRVGAQVIPYQRSLREIQAMTLDWRTKTAHPQLYMSQAEIEASRPTWIEGEQLTKIKQLAVQPWQQQPHRRDTAALQMWLMDGLQETANQYGLIEKTVENIGLLGDFDKMRLTVRVCGLFDAMIDSGLIPEAQKPLLKAQMAYLGYMIADPTTWNRSRGWSTDNLNMTVSYEMQALGTLAATIPDHPMADAWRAQADAVFKEMLAQVGPDGEWPESVGYANLAVSELLTYAIATNQADDDRLQRAVRCLVGVRTPHDPRTGIRDHIRYGRSPGSVMPIDAALSRAIGDPELLSTWLDDRSLEIQMGGFEVAYLDPRLPAASPSHESREYHHLGAILRQGDSELLAVLSGDHRHMIYGSQTGAIASLFAQGKPVGGSFAFEYDWGCQYLTNRVSIASRPQDFEPKVSPYYYLGQPEGGTWFDDSRLRATYNTQAGDGNTRILAAQKYTDYVCIDIYMNVPKVFSNGRAPPAGIPWPDLIAGAGNSGVWWRRQILAMRGTPTMYLVRDTVSGNQPTMWQFWSQSNGIDTQGPGDAVSGPRELFGDLFCAYGDYGIDLDYYVASPRLTPRHTIRYGGTRNVSAPWGITQYQDALILQLEDDGEYYVLLYPRDRNLSIPTYGEQNGIVSISDTGGETFLMLSSDRRIADNGVVQMDGTACAVRNCQGRIMLSLGSAGRIEYQGYVLESNGPKELVI